MPLNGPALTAAEIDIVRKWIEEGAEWNGVAQPAYRIAPLELRPPVIAGAEKNPVDKLLALYLRRHNIETPAPVSDAIFARRVYLDLWGLLPTPEQLAEFLKDSRTDKREQLIDTLLANRTNYSEHWISYWNDLLHNDEGVNYAGGVRKPLRDGC